MTVGSLLTVSALAAGAFLLHVGNTHTDMWVDGVDTDDTFTFELPHHRFTVSAKEYSFSTQLSWEEILQELERQHPQGYSDGEDSWRLASASTPVVIQPLDDTDGGYVLISQTARLTDQSGHTLADFPFPVSPTQADWVPAATVIDLAFPAKDLVDFYEKIPEARIADDVISVPSSAGKNVDITITGQEVFVGLAQQ
ncbi:hypothetical protein [Jonesia quinghaiensis]|uniref:hypothetical protein n=1 Tax=Jonesia quinghaiensis TaxID=262806 RepID=UPI00049133D8|nr:hypothetical protein [Jonesia quinghaiensis]